MPMILALTLLSGLFTEERVPAPGYACLSVRYRGILYKARKFERTRLTGTIVLTLAAPFDPLSELLGTKAKGRVMQLSGYEGVTDSTSCSCGLYQGTCVDR